MSIRPNITCTGCGHRHPADRHCDDAKQMAADAQRIRELELQLASAKQGAAQYLDELRRMHRDVKPSRAKVDAWGLRALMTAHACCDVQQALARLRLVGAKKAAGYLARALKSVDGARRHAQGRRDRLLREYRA